MSPAEREAAACAAEGRGEYGKAGAIRRGEAEEKVAHATLAYGAMELLAKVTAEKDAALAGLERYRAAFHREERRAVEAEADLVAATRRADRLAHGEDIESDRICSHELEAHVLREALTDAHVQAYGQGQEMATRGMLDRLDAWYESSRHLTLAEWIEGERANLPKSGASSEEKWDRSAQCDQCGAYQIPGRDDERCPWHCVEERGNCDGILRPVVALGKDGPR